MNKKIFVIGILILFLMLNFLPLSVLGQKVEVGNKTRQTTDVLPDLRISPQGYGWWLGIFQLSCYIYNDGPATLDIGTKIDWKLEVEGQEELDFTFTLEAPLRPEKVIFLLDYDEKQSHFFSILEIGNKLITYTVDPNYKIEELNEDNNVWSDVEFKGKARNLYWPFSSLLSRFSTLQRILEKLG
jgi:hypothetical protein